VLDRKRAASANRLNATLSTRAATADILSSAAQDWTGNLYNSDAGANGVIRQLEVLEPVARFATFGLLLAPKKQFDSS
jgi:hypothetical protein